MFAVLNMGHFVEYGYAEGGEICVYEYVYEYGGDVHYPNNGS